MEQELKKLKGITLIALVITIVVLVILAAVVIQLSLGNNGIFNRAKTAKEMYSNAQEHEKEVVESDIVIGNRNVSESEMIELIKEYGTPVGTVISLMGNSAPDWYLPCNGQWYDINGDYKNLAEYIKTQFGSYDYFKLSGETSQSGKFKVPDLRGEFLRGTGTNSRANQGSGANVGEHKDATKIPDLVISGSYTNLVYTNKEVYVANADTRSSQSLGGRYYISGKLDPNINWYEWYTSRPTNTSVLYCIKYK